MSCAFLAGSCLVLIAFVIFDLCWDCRVCIALLDNAVLRAGSVMITAFGRHHGGSLVVGCVCLLWFESQCSSASRLCDGNGLGRYHGTVPTCVETLFVSSSTCGMVL